MFPDFQRTVRQDRDDELFVYTVAMTPAFNQPNRPVQFGFVILQFTKRVLRNR